MKPKPGEIVQDPAAGTGGFLVAADQYIKKQTDDLYALTKDQAFFQRHNAFTGAELVPDTHRLCMMNLLLHGIELCSLHTILRLPTGIFYAQGVVGSSQGRKAVLNRQVAQPELPSWVSMEGERISSPLASRARTGAEIQYMATNAIPSS